MRKSCLGPCSCPIGGAASDRPDMDGIRIRMRSPGVPGGGPRGGGHMGGGHPGGFGGGPRPGGFGGPWPGRFGMGPRLPRPYTWWPFYRRPGCGCYTLVLSAIALGVLALILFVF